MVGCSEIAHLDLVIELLFFEFTCKKMIVMESCILSPTMFLILAALFLTKFVSAKDVSLMVSQKVLLLIFCWNFNMQRIIEKQNKVVITDRMWARLLSSTNQPSFLNPRDISEAKKEDQPATGLLDGENCKDRKSMTEDDPCIS